MKGAATRGSSIWSDQRIERHCTGHSNSVPTRAQLGDVDWTCLAARDSGLRKMDGCDDAMLPFTSSLIRRCSNRIGNRSGC